MALPSTLQVFKHNNYVLCCVALLLKIRDLLNEPLMDYAGPDISFDVPEQLLGIHAGEQSNMAVFGLKVSVPEKLESYINDLPKGYIAAENGLVIHPNPLQKKGSVNDELTTTLHGLMEEFQNRRDQQMKENRVLAKARKAFGSDDIAVLKKIAHRL